MTTLDRIRGAGVELKADGDRLLVRGSVSAVQRDWLTAHKAELLAELRTPRRAIIEYQFAGDPAWHVMLGLDGESFEEAAAACCRQFGAIVTRERDTLPAGFPFKRHDDEGEMESRR